MSEPKFRGIVPPVPAIFDANGQFDRVGQGKMIDFLIKGGADVLLFNGSAGEFSQMSEALRLEVAEFCVKYVNKRIPVIVGSAAPGTAETIRFTQHAKDIGADGVIIVNPYYCSLTEEAIYQHYKAITAAVDIPIILYNFPRFTNHDLSVDLVKRLALDFPNIVGIKDTVDTVRHTRDLIQAIKPLRPDFAIFAGFDEYMLETLIMGGDGCFPSSMNFAPHLATGLIKAVKEKDGAKILELQRQITLIPPMFGLDTPFYGVLKEAVKLAGVEIDTYALPPAHPLSDEKKAKVRETLKQVGVLK
ncbi:MAG: dihydrodipicolinate synthetase [Proteobacteria bacterium]|nr:dihydrodipicolinate synthetase [Pseudomonadota bacterium]